MNQLVEFIQNSRESIHRTYRDLHDLAEPSWQERNTSDYIAAALQKAGISVTRFEGHYGLVADIPGESEEVVALRADMDALVQEVGGQVVPNHSCGHDAHSTMVLYTALAYAACQPRLSKSLRFIFQPAEEKGEGAIQMMREGVLNRVNYLFGLHLRPAFEVAMGKAASAIFHGSCATFNGIIKGTQAHAARPQDGRNAIEAASWLIQSMPHIRLNNPESYSIKMTRLHAGGGASNVIPETAEFTLDLRARTNETMDELRSKLQALLHKVGDLTETTITGKFGEFVPAARVNEEAARLARAAIAHVLGEENATPACVSPGAEDFHFYTLQVPDLKATMIGLGCDLRPGLHHPDMRFNLEALSYGTQILSTLVYQAAATVTKI